MHLQLWFSYAPCCQSLIILFAHCKWHSPLLGKYMACRPLRRWWTWSPHWHWPTVLQQFAFVKHFDAFYSSPHLCLCHKLWLLEQTHTVSSIHMLKDYVSWKPGTANITYGSGKLKMNWAIGGHYHQHQECFWFIHDSWDAAQCSSCQDVWRQYRA